MIKVSENGKIVSFWHIHLGLEYHVILC